MIAVLTITAVSAGAVDYLLHGCGCAEHEHGQKAELGGAGYMLAGAEKEPPGIWYGTGLEELLGIEAGAVATEEQVRAVLGRLEHPTAVDEKGEPVSLGRRPFRFKSREEREAAALAAEPDATEDRQAEIRAKVRASERKAVAYYDLTFSPAKSVSVYWASLLAAGRTAEAENVVAAHNAGVAAAMAYVEREAAYVRSGYHGKTASGRSVGMYEKANGLAWIRWNHSTSRDQQPQLHAHTTVVNRATTSSDRVVRALDGKGFRPIKQGADAIYRATYEQLLPQTNTVAFVTRPDGKAREIMGYGQRLLAKASSRRKEITAKVDDAVAAFAAAHQRAPSPAERKMIDRIAWRETRSPKNYVISPREQLRRWARPLRRELDKALVVAEAGAAKTARVGHPDQQGYAGRSREQVVRDAIGVVQQRYSTWEVGNLVDAIADELKRTPAVAEPAVELADEVLRNGAVYGVVGLTAPDPGPVPEALQREDGKSRYRPAHQEWWTTTGQLGVEAAIVARARETGAPAVAGPVLKLARIEAERAGLSPDQRDAVAGILGSGRRGDVLIGPAGAGKSRAVATLAAVWEAHLGGRVLGVATSQIAADVLAEDGLTALNTRVFLQRFGPDGQGRVRDRIRAGDLVVIDEAGMSSTGELEAISTLVAAGGGKLVFTGDHEQLKAVGAGGMLELLVRDASAYQLSEIHRFHQAWEREASVRLRAGDPDVLGEYAEHGRIRGGSEAEMAEAAVRGYLADVLSGHSSLLVVHANDTATALSARIRAELVAAGKVSAEVLGETRDANLIAAGDLIQARRNDRSLRVDGAGMVTNREVYTVLGADTSTDALRVQDRNGLVAHLPRDYVNAHTTLAYAVTGHAAQGVTRWSSHSLIDEKTSRELGYVAGTRGREANTFYVTCRRDPDQHSPERLDRGAVDVLADVLTRPVEGLVAAEIARRHGVEEGRSLAWVGTQWDLLTSEYGRLRYTATLTGLLGAERADALVAEPGFERLMAAVRRMELGGHDPDALLAQVVSRGRLDNAHSVSDVLRHRIGLAESDGRRPERDVRGGDWTRLTQPVEGAVGGYVRLLAWAATARQHELGERAAADPPTWALEAKLLGPVPADQHQRGEWVRRAGIVAAYRDLHAVPDTQISLGPAPNKNRAFHHVLWQQAYAALGHPADALDYAAAGDVELRGMRQAWAHARTYAPEYVAGQLAEARERAEDYRRDAVIWEAGLHQHPAGSPERSRAEADLAAARHLAAVGAARVGALEEIHRERRRWYQRTETVRERARFAGDELERRGRDRDTAVPVGEQAELFPVGEPESQRAETGRDQREHIQHRRREPEPLLERGYQDVREQAAAAVERETHQPGLFAARPTPADLAAAQPLHTREPSATSTNAAGRGREADRDRSPADVDEAVITLGEAARQARILARLREGIDAATRQTPTGATRRGRNGPAGDDEFEIGTRSTAEPPEQQHQAAQRQRSGAGLHL